MSEIAELEQRIAAAFDRMDRGLDRLARTRAEAALDPASDAPSADAPVADVPVADAPPVDAPETPPHITALLRALETAKTSSAEWADRYRALEAQMGAETMAMATEIARLTALLDSTPQPAAPDRDAEIDDLTARIAAQEAELETLRALRAADAAEIGDLVSALAPLVQEASHV